MLWRFSEYRPQRSSLTLLRTLAPADLARGGQDPEKPWARANTLLGMTRGGIGSTVVRVHRTVGRGVTVYRLKGGTKTPTNLQSAASAHYRTAPGVRG